MFFLIFIKYFFSLKSNTKYRFRLASQNDMGISDYSRSTNYIRTKESSKIFQKKKKKIFYNIYLVPLIQPEIVQLTTNQPCQIDIYLKDLDSIDKNTRLKVLIKSISNEQFFQKSYHSINEDSSIHLTNLCTDSHMNDTYILYICLSNSIGDGPLSFAHYFHIQSSLPNDIIITSLNVTVLSSTEISIQWNINRILTSIGYRIRWIIANETIKEKSLIASYNQSNVILDDLIPFTIYKIMINTFNINGDGSIQEADLVRTNEDGMSTLSQCFIQDDELQ